MTSKLSFPTQEKFSLSFTFWCRSLSVEVHSVEGVKIYRVKVIQMGSGTSQSQELDRFYHRFSVIQRDADKNLLYMQEKKTGRQYVLRQLTTNDQIQKRLIEVLVQQKRSTRNKFLVRLEDHFFVNNQNYCSSQFKAYLLFESHYKDLREEMLDRRLRSSCFDQDELYSIVESGCMGLKYLKEINQPHESVSSNSVLINREGVVMLTDPWLAIDSTNSTNMHTYPSPEKLQTISNNRASYDWFTSDLFSLGMVVLEAANMEFLDGVYQPNNRDINYHLLDSKIKNIRSPKIRNYVERLLKSEKFRIDVVQEVDYQVRAGSKTAITNQTTKAFSNKIERPIETNRTLTSITSIEQPVVQNKVPYTLPSQNVGESRFVQSIIQNPPVKQARVYSNIVGSSMPSASLNPPPQVGSVIGQTMNKLSAQTKVIQPSTTVPQIQTVYKAPSAFQSIPQPKQPVGQPQPMRQTRQRVDNIPKRQRVDSTGNIKTSTAQPYQSLLNLKPSTQQQNNSVMFKNIEVRNRSIDNQKLNPASMKKDVTFSYSLTNNSSSSTTQKSLLATKGQTNSMANLLKSPTPPPSFTKPKEKSNTSGGISTFSNGTSLKTTQTNQLASKAPAVSSSSLTTAVKSSPPPTQTINRTKLNGIHVPVYEAKPIPTPELPFSKYEGPSFIKKVPPPVNSSMSVNSSFTTAHWQSQSITQTIQQTQSFASKPEDIFKNYDNERNINLLNSSVSKINEILNSQLNYSEVEPAQRPEKQLEATVKELPAFLKKTTDTLTISTSKEPDAYIYNLPKYQHTFHQTPEASSPEEKFQAYEYFLDREAKPEIKSQVQNNYEKDYRFADKSPMQKHFPQQTHKNLPPQVFQYPTETYQNIYSESYAFDYSKYDWKKQEKSSRQESQVTGIVNDYTSPMPSLVPPLSIPTTAVTTPAVQSDRINKAEPEQSTQRQEENHGIETKADKTERVYSKSSEFQEILYRPLQAVQEAPKQITVESVGAKIENLQENRVLQAKERGKSEPLSAQYQPSYEIPHSSSIYMGRVEVPIEQISEPKYLLSYDMEEIKPPPQKADIRVSEVEIDTSQSGKSSIQQQSVLNNSSKSLINAMNMTEPPPPAFLLQSNPVQVPAPQYTKPKSPQPPAVQQPPQQLPAVKQQQPEPAAITPSRPRGAHLQKYNSTIAEVSESDNSNSNEVEEEDSEYVIEEYEVGSRYEGYKRGGMRNGKGKFYYQDGGYYEGEWKDNKMHGEGKLYYSENKLAYEGEWYMDEFHGHGKVYNDNPILLDGPFNYKDFDELDEYWVYYQGNLITDTKQGLGKLKLSNGEVFEGEFKYDRIEGKGRFVTISGQVINGLWRDSKLVKVL